MFDDTESIYTQRVCTNEKDSDDVATELSSVAPLNLANEVITTYFFEDCMGLPSSIVAPRATKMFTEGDGAPRTSGMDKIATNVSLFGPENYFDSKLKYFECLF